MNKLKGIFRIMDRIWHIEGTMFAILNIHTGRYISHFADEKLFVEEIMIFDTPKSASAYIAKCGLNKNIFKVTEMQNCLSAQEIGRLA